jgi:putative iron-dependent peroxidase
VRAQPGIFSLGTTEHCFVELDFLPAADPAVLVAGLASVVGPESSAGGLSVVVGFRPELWAEVAPASARSNVRSFEAIHGAGFTVPATQHDAWLWVAGGRKDAVFDAVVSVIDSVRDGASVASELTGWVYRHDRDLTGFIDGTENPSLLEAHDVAVLPQDGSSVLLYQQWRHLPAWRELPVCEQERVIGRTRDDSTELAEDEMPPDSHVSRTVIEEDGEELAIFRRNVAYGGPTDHGTVFVGFCATQHPLDAMLRRMAGADEEGIRDALTRYTEALRSAYYLIPSVDALGRFVPVG